MDKSNTQLSASGFNYISKTSYFESKHKSRPGKFFNAEEARQKRTERKSLHRKSARISVFDNGRNMSPVTSPAPPVTSTQAKLQRRRLQLQQWKEEKDKKKLEEANKKKKKPFVVGTVRAPLAFEPLPPAKPNSTGRVTRSQTIKNKNPPQMVLKNPPSGSLPFFVKMTKITSDNSSSFAPVNAAFHPPKIDMPFASSSVVNNGKSNRMKAKQAVTFDPVVKSNTEAIQKAQAEKITNEQATVLRKTFAVKTLKTKNSNQQTMTKTVTTTIYSQNVGVLSSKDNTKNLRSTRQNSRIADKEKLIQPLTKPIHNKTKIGQNNKVNKKPLQDKPQTTPKRKSLLEAPKSESAVEEKLRTPEEKLEQNKMEAAPQMSPYVTVSRGKKNARKEAIDKIKDGLLGDGADDEKTPSDFRNQLNSEIQRLTTISDEWDKYAQENDLPEHVQELILAAVGQTRLLVSKKLQQFSSLVDLCTSGRRRPEGAVTTTDLQGFWDMVFMQVENVDMRFKTLRELRDRQWATEEQPRPHKKMATNKKKNAGAAKKNTGGGTSKIRAMIEAARKACVAPKTDSLNPLLTAGADNKVFQAGFFSVTSPVRAAPARTPRATPRASLLRDVLSSEASKATSTHKVSASRAMMKASLISKSMDSPVTISRTSPSLSPLAINLEATPARSILKTPVPRSTRRKSVKTVLFEDVEPLSAPLGFRPLIITPEKEEAPKQTPKKNRRSAKTFREDQENLEPSAETPPRRITRNMRRSLLQETQEAAGLELTVELAVKPRRKTRDSARGSALLTEVH